MGGLFSDFEAVRTATVSIHTGAVARGGDGRLTVRFARIAATVGDATSQRIGETSEIAESALLFAGPSQRTDALSLWISEEKTRTFEQHAGAI